MAALARGRTLLQENVIIGNVRMRTPGPASVPSRVLVRKNQLSILQSPQQPSGIGRALSTFCNSSVIGVQPPTLLLSSNAMLSFFHESRQMSTEEKSVLLPHEVDFSKIIFGQPKKNARGGQFIPINYGSAFKTLRIQTPVQRIPFGLQSYENQSGYTLLAAFDNYESNSQLKRFMDFVKKFDEHVLATAQKNAKDWFSGKNLIPQVIEANFTRNIKEPKDIKYSPLMKFKIPVVKDAVDIEVYIDSEPVTMEALTANSMVVNLIEPRSIWFVSGKFGVTWTLRQSKIMEAAAADNQGKLGSYSFRDSDISYTKKNPSESVSPNPPPPVEPARDVAEEEEEVSEEESESEIESPKTAKTAPKAIPTKIGSPARSAPTKPAAAPSKPVVTPASKVAPKSNPMPIKSSVSPKKK